MCKIIELDILNQDIQDQVLQLQQVSYRLEEVLIGFPIPHTKETADDLLASGDIFIGMSQDDELLGLVAFAADETTMDIHRVAVDPDYFRQGVATELLEFLFDAFPGISQFLVTTGASNIPAIRLYEKMGFHRLEDFEPAPGLIMTRLKRSN